MTGKLILLHLAAYLIGAIPTAVWFGKALYGKDVRKFGSGNAGATNTFRVLGAKAGIIVLLIDIAKGATAVLLAGLLRNEVGAEMFTLLQITLGLTAAIGHIYPVYLRFKGGKGVATFFGVALIIFPMAALLCVVAFAIVFLFTRYVSLSSMLASVVFMITILTTDSRTGYWPVVAFSIAVPLLILYTHRTNILRLVNGTESKMNFSKGKH